MASRWIDGSVVIPLVIAVVIIAAALAVGGVVVGTMATVVVYLIFISIIVRIPLRYPLYALAFLALTLENPGDAPAQGQFQSPIYPVGSVLLMHLNAIDRSVTAFNWIMFSGMDFCLAALLVVAGYRRLTGSTMDSAGATPAPRPLVRLAYVSLLGMLGIWAFGIARGGDVAMSLWQLDRVMYLPIVFLLFSIGLRGPRDLVPLARVLCIAAVYKAIWAFVVINTVFLYPNWETGGLRLSYATSHHDSMLFALALFLPIAMKMEGVGRAANRLMAMILPIVVIGIFSNNRRMAWVQVAVVLLTMYLVTPDNRFKRGIRKLSVASIPLVLVYLAVGWNNKSFFLFKPIASLRSVVDAESNPSSFWREIENFDLISTIQAYPFLGTGYGHPFLEVVTMPAVGYSLEKFAPHNAILGLIAYGGVLGYTALTILWIGGIYCGMRAYHASDKASVRAGALTSIAAVPIYMIQCWGDLGLGTWTGVWLTAPAVAMAGKLAVASGGWSTQTASSKLDEQPPPKPWSADRAA